VDQSVVAVLMHTVLTHTAPMHTVGVGDGNSVVLRMFGVRMAPSVWATTVITRPEEGVQ
jgi:hypothetical protein